MYRDKREKKKKEDFFCFRGALCKSWGQCNHFWLLGLVFFINLMLGTRSTPASPWLGCAPWVASVLNICSGLDAVSHECSSDACEAQALQQPHRSFLNLCELQGSQGPILQCAEQLQLPPTAMRVAVSAQHSSGDTELAAKLCPCHYENLTSLGNIYFPQTCCRNN